jgi:pantoate--beta-alanine ligase
LFASLCVFQPLIIGLNNSTVVSIFVNPTQFNNPEDLSKYPRTLESDIAKIIGLSLIFYTHLLDDIYDGKLSQPFDFDGLENQMEGKFRPGHFDGRNSRKRFFEIVTTNAYFEKRFPAVTNRKKKWSQNNLEVNVIGCYLQRVQRLAMSSKDDRSAKRRRLFNFKTLNLAKKKKLINSATAVTQWSKNHSKQILHLS